MYLDSSVLSITPNMMSSISEFASKSSPSRNTRIYDHDIWTLPSCEVSKMSTTPIREVTTNTSRISADHSVTVSSNTDKSLLQQVHSSSVNIEETPMTPTTPSNRIPDIESCPPAPKKPKSRPILKRKCSSDGCGSNIHNVTRLLDFSKEIESMYPPFLQANLGRKIKKARSI